MNFVLLIDCVRFVEHSNDPFQYLNLAKLSYIFVSGAKTITGKVVAIIFVYAFIEIRLTVAPNRL